MIIAVACPTCARRYDVAGRLAGKKVRCKQCATHFRVPVPTIIPSPAPIKPKTRRTRKDIPSITDVLLSIEPDSQEGAPLAAPESGEHPNPSGPARSRFVGRLVVLLTAGLIVAWLLGFIATRGTAILLSLTLGGVSLMSAIAGRELFQGPLHKRITSLLRPDRARMLGAIAGVTLLVMAILLSMDVIQIPSHREEAAVVDASRAAQHALREKYPGQAVTIHVGGLPEDANDRESLALSLTDRIQALAPDAKMARSANDSELSFTIAPIRDAEGFLQAITFGKASRKGLRIDVTLSPDFIGENQSR